MTDSLLDSLAAKAAPIVGAQTSKWISMAVDALNTDLMPLVPPELQGALAAAVVQLKANQDLIAGTTVEGFTALVSHLAMGREDQARLTWLSSSADFDADMAALDDAFEATQADVKRKADTWATVKSVALDLVMAGGKALVPVLLGLIPL